MRLCRQVHSEFVGQFWYDFKQIADQPDIGDLENRCLLVLVDRDDRLAVLHAREMLDRSLYDDGYVDIGRDDLAGLADLVIVGGIACVDRRAGCAHRSAEPVRQREKDGGEAIPIL